MPGSRVVLWVPMRLSLTNVDSGETPMKGISSENPISRQAKIKHLEEMSVDDIAVCIDPSLVSLLEEWMPARWQRLPVFDKICSISDVGMPG